MRTMNFHKSLTLMSLLVLVSALILWPQTASAEVILAHNYVYTNNVKTEPPGTVTFTNLLYSNAKGLGTYSSEINVGTEGLWVDSTKRVTGEKAQIAIKGNITAGNYRQVDSDFKVEGGTDYSGGQSGIITLNGGMTANFSGDFTTGGHTTTYIGSGSTSTANVTVGGNLFLGSTMTSTLIVEAGSTLTANKGFVIQKGSQGILKISGIVNMNGTQSEPYTNSNFNWDCVSLGTNNNSRYTSQVHVNSGGTLNIPYAIAHCGLEGQLYFNINSGGTANIYGLTYANNGDPTSANKNQKDGEVVYTLHTGDPTKTLIMKGGTLNIGDGGIKLRSGKTSYPLIFINGTVSTLDMTVGDQKITTTTSEIALDVNVGQGTTTLSPKTGATLKFSGTIADATEEMYKQPTPLEADHSATGADRYMAYGTNYATIGTGGKLEVKGAGTTEFAGTVSNTNGFSVEGGTALLSGKLTTKATVNSGTLKISSTNTANTGTITANGGTVEVNGAQVYNALVFKGGTLSSTAGGTSYIKGGVTLETDVTFTANARLEFWGEGRSCGAFVGNNHVFTKSGSQEIIIQDFTNGLGVSAFTINQGGLVFQGNSTKALEVPLITVNEGGQLTYWGQQNVNTAKTVFNGGSFRAGATATSSTTATAVFELQKDTTFSTQPYTGGDPALNNFYLNGTLQSTKAVTLTKNDTGSMYIAGSADGFQGTINVQKGGFKMANGGNSSATNQYAFGFKLSGGTLSFTKAGTYAFADSQTVFNFASTSGTSVDLGGSVISLGSGSKIESVANAQTSLTNGSILLRDGGSLALNVTQGTLTLPKVTGATDAKQAALTKTGDGALTLAGSGSNVRFTQAAGAGRITVGNGVKMELYRDGNKQESEKAPITVNAGGTLTLTHSETAQPIINNPITLNGGELISAKNTKSQFCRVNSITLTADSTITVGDRIELTSAMQAEGKKLTITGTGEFFFNKEGNKAQEIVSTTTGTFGIQGGASKALTNVGKVTVKSGKFHVWDVSNFDGNIVLDGAYFDVNGGGTSSTSSSATITWLKSSNFSVSTIATTAKPFTMNGKIVAGKEITISKTGKQDLIIAGKESLTGMDGTFDITSGKIILQTGGNTPETAYGATFKINGGELAFGDSGDYYFKDGTNFIQNVTGTTVDLNDATIHVTGETKISSKIAATFTNGTVEAEAVVFETSADKNSVKPLDLTDLTIDADDISFSLTGADLDYTQLTGQTIMTTDRGSLLEGLTFSIASNVQLPTGMFLYGLGQTDGSITIQTGVPEPATWVLLLFGFGGLAVVKRKRSRS